MLAAGLLPDQCDHSNDLCIWERLTRLRRAGATLGSEATERLRQIEAAHSDWQYTGDEREDFPVRVWTLL